MKHRISFAPGLGLAIALLGSGCIVVPGEGDTAQPAIGMLLELELPTGTCWADSRAQSPACDATIASPESAAVIVSVSWNESPQGPVEVRDNCGGSFLPSIQDGVYLGSWTPPAAGGTCLMVATAVSPDGRRGEVAMAVRVPPRPPESFPLVSAELVHDNGTCRLAVGETQVICDAPILAGSLVQVSVFVDWGGLEPNQYGFSTDCSGELTGVSSSDQSTHRGTWQAGFIDQSCKITAEAIAIDGTTTRGDLFVQIVNGQPPGGVYAYVYIEHAGGMCYLNPGEYAVECGPIAPGDTPLVYAEISWGNATPGDIVFRDSCGGAFTESFRSETNVETRWTTPTEPAACTIQVEATTGDGQVHVFEVAATLN